MKRMLGGAFFVVMLTMSALVGGVHFAAKSYVDPTLKDLNRTVAAMPPEAQKEVMPYLRELERHREMGSLYVPSVLFLAGLTAVLILSFLFRKLAADGAEGVIAGQRPERIETATSAEQERATKAVPGDPIDVGACRILSILQNKGRLIDFFQEDITGYPDAQIGAAVRHMHQDCRNALREYVTLTPVMSEREGEPVVVSEGFDPSEIRLTGHITGRPPFEGILQHSGWKITRIQLPEQPKGHKYTVIAPAEVEMEQTE